MKIKKLGTFVLAAGLMLSSMTVSAAPEGRAQVDGPNIHYYPRGEGPDMEAGYGYYKEVHLDWLNTTCWEFHGMKEPTPENTLGLDSFNEGDCWVDLSNDKWSDVYLYEDNKWVFYERMVYEDDEEEDEEEESVPKSKSKKSKSKKKDDDGPKPLTQKDIEDIISQAETEALQKTAASEGFTDIVDMQKAAAKNMSAGEYFNNAVVETPGIEDAVTVAQGGGIIIDGVQTNVMATISKVDVAFVDSVRASVEGTILNVVDVQFPAIAATINFYMPGVSAETNIAAVQYVGGTWVDVEVAEVRADHVVLNLKQNGKVAFIAK